VNKFLILLISLILFSNVFSQDTTKSQAFKKNQFKIKYPLIKPKYPAYPLMAGYILKQKAKEGDALAEHELGLRYLLGRGFPKDTAQAVYWIHKAAESGIPAAQFNYAIMLVNSIGVKWNPFEAFKNFKVAAESGMPEAEYILGLFYLDNLVVNKNALEAYKWLKKASDAGNKASKKTLKALEKSGIKFNVDSLTAETPQKQDTLTSQQISEPALQNGSFELDYYHFKDEPASIDTEINELNQLLRIKKTKLEKYIGVTLDSSEVKNITSLNLINKAASFGSPEALMILGKLTESKGDSTNLLKAMEYYLRAFRLGTRNAGERIINLLNNPLFLPLLDEGTNKKEPAALYIYAALNAYKFYYGLPDEQIVKFLEEAAKLNHIPSIIELGLLYNNGTIVKKDSDKAKELFQKAVDLGSNEGKVRLVMLNLVNGNSNEIKNDIKLLENQAKYGSVLAQIALAYSYKNGIGKKKNKAEADKLYRIAASRGNRTAYNALKNMYDEIRPNDEIFQIVEQ